METVWIEGENGRHGLRTLTKFPFALALCLAACGGNSPVAQPRPAVPAALEVPAVPAKLKVPAGHKVAIVAEARGAQVYVCQPKKDDATRYEWALTAPDARLYDASGHEIGRHYKGPTWASSDGSKVVGNLEQKVDAPGADDIAWLLLSAKSNEGQGAFRNVTFIQRLGTHGGKPPTADADAAHAGKESRVEYQATYYFYVSGP